MEIPQKTKNRIAIWSINSTFEYLSEENKNLLIQKKYVCLYVYGNTVDNSQDMEAT